MDLAFFTLDNDVVIFRVEFLASHLIAALARVDYIIGVAGEISARGSDIVVVLYRPVSN